MDKKKQKTTRAYFLQQCYQVWQTWDTSLYLLYDNDDPFWLTMIWGP